MAKARFSELIGEVANGETVVITLHGKPVVRMIPETTGRQAQIKRAIDAIKALRKQTKGATAEEILAWRDEGRK